MAVHNTEVVMLRIHLFLLMDHLSLSKGVVCEAEADVSLLIHVLPAYMDETLINAAFCLKNSYSREKTQPLLLML